jgi:hypothetical protein
LLYWRISKNPSIKKTKFSLEGHLSPPIDFHWRGTRTLQLIFIGGALFPPIDFNGGGYMFRQVAVLGTTNSKKHIFFQFIKNCSKITKNHLQELKSQENHFLQYFTGVGRI